MIKSNFQYHLCSSCLWKPSFSTIKRWSSFCIVCKNYCRTGRKGFMHSQLLGSYPLACMATGIQACQWKWGLNISQACYRQCRNCQKEAPSTALFMMKSSFYQSLTHSANNSECLSWILPLWPAMNSGPSSWCEPPADPSSLAYTQQEAHTNMQELETSPGHPTSQGIFAVNLAHVSLSLITALSYMGKTRVTQTVNSHGWKNAAPAGCFHFESETKAERTDMAVPHSVYSVLCNREGTWPALFSSFCYCAEVLALPMYPLKLTHIALAHIFMVTIEKPQKRREELQLSFTKKKDHMPTTIHASSSRGSEEKSAVNST